MTRQITPIKAGDTGKRAIIALYLTPESADDLASTLRADDLGAAELHEAADAARAWLGETSA